MALPEPLRLKLGSEYNLNNVKELEVTNEFLTLEKSIMNCQNYESLEDCQSRKYIEAMVKHCNCLPFGTTSKNKVSCYILIRA